MVLPSLQSIPRLERQRQWPSSQTGHQWPLGIWLKTYVSEWNGQWLRNTLIYMYVHTHTYSHAYMLHTSTCCSESTWKYRHLKPFQWKEISCGPWLLTLRIFQPPVLLTLPMTRAWEPAILLVFLRELRLTLSGHTFMVVNKELPWFACRCQEDALTQLAAKPPQVEDQCSEQGTLANPTFSHRWLSGTSQSLAGQRLTRHKMRVADVRLIRIAYHSKTTQKM